MIREFGCNAPDARLRDLLDRCDWTDLSIDHIWHVFEWSETSYNTNLDEMIETDLDAIETNLDELVSFISMNQPENLDIKLWCINRFEYVSTDILRRCSG